MAILAHVEQRFAVVDRDVGDVLLRRAGVPDAGDTAPAGGIAHAGETRQIARQADADSILLVEGDVTGIARAAGAARRVVAQAVDETLVGHHRRPAVEGTAPARTVSQAIVEAANAGAGQLHLRGEVCNNGRHLGIRRPALAIDVREAAAICGGNQLDRGSRREHRALGDHAHDIKAEAVDLVLIGPGDQRIGHELGHHRPLGGRIGAAGVILHRAAGVQAVVVARYHPIQNGLGVLTTGGSVVVHHVHDHAQPDGMQGLHHLPEFQDARQAIVRIARIAALRRPIVQGVVTPVEAIRVLRGLDVGLGRDTGSGAGGDGGRGAGGFIH